MVVLPREQRGKLRAFLHEGLHQKMEEDGKVVMELDGEDVEITPDLVDVRIDAKEGFAVVGANNDRFEMLKGMCRCRVVTVSGKAAFACPLVGDYNSWNMALAWACAKELGVTEAMARVALEGFSLPGDRWRTSERDGVTFISDCYNANPTSMIAALRAFAAEPCAGRRIAVLGDMFELGAESERLHAEVKREAAALRFDKVIYVGENFGGVSRDEAKAELFAFARTGDAVLLKASHGMALNRILEQ